jgi:hypothetical protein
MPQTIDPRSPQGDRIGMSRYCDHLERRVEDLEVCIRAALSFMQERFPDHSDGHAVMVIAAMRGALRTKLPEKDNGD